MALSQAMPYTQLKRRLSLASSTDDLYDLVANAPFDYTVETALLFLGFISFFLVDEKAQVVRLAGVTHNEHYEMSIRGYAFNPKTFKLSLNETDNSIVKAIISGQKTGTGDWTTIKRSQANDEATRLNQANSGIASSVIYPLSGKRRGAIMYNFFQYSEDMGAEQQEFMEYYTRLVEEALDT